MDWTHLESTGSWALREEGRAGAWLESGGGHAELHAAHGPGTGDWLRSCRGGGTHGELWGICLPGDGGFTALSLFFYFRSYIHGMQNRHLFLLGHMREPLEKIIIYEAREREGERGREGGEGRREEGREKQKAFYYSGHW